MQQGRLKAGKPPGTCAAVPGVVDAVAWYDEHSTDRATQYESLAASEVHAWLLDILPPSPAVALDVGAGSGRDAAWLASLGYTVHAVEPSGAMRLRAAESHPGLKVSWSEDRMPGLETLDPLEGKVNLALLSAVWMHVAPCERAAAFERLEALAAPDGIMALTLREGPAEPGRAMHPVSLSEIASLAEANGLQVVRMRRCCDKLGRADVSWSYVALRKPGIGLDQT